MLTAIFEKFKEKKVNVVTALREAADAIYLTVSDLGTHTHTHTHTRTHTLARTHMHIHMHTHC